jgi:hypothetical protein
MVRRRRGAKPPPRRRQARVIISASYKTDIPTFYGAWFRNRLRAGYCATINPYNRRVSRVDLSRAAVDAFVFWTKNAAPFLTTLDEVRERGYPFVVQYTINAYPRALEHAVIDPARSIETAWKIRDAHGPHALVWRYDPIVFSSLTPHDFHVDNFARLAAALRGATDEVVVSVAQVYRKTRRNLDAAATEHDFQWDDPSDDAKRRLLAALTPIAQDHGLQLTLCSQAALAVPGSRAARCVDAARLAAIGGTPLAAKPKGNRPDCECHESRDIGDYDTCPHGCAYCYAVQERPLALDRFRRHDPTSEFLFDPPVAVDRKPLPVV